MAERKRRMTLEQFETIRPFLKMSEPRIAAARKALIEPGLTLQHIANEYGWSRQAVDEAAKVAWKAFEVFQSRAGAAGIVLPPGWEQATFVAPAEVIAHLRDEIVRAASPEKQSPSVGTGLKRQRKGS